MITIDHVGGWTVLGRNAVYKKQSCSLCSEVRRNTCEEGKQCIHEGKVINDCKYYFVTIKEETKTTIQVSTSKERKSHLDLEIVDTGVLLGSLKEGRKEVHEIRDREGRYKHKKQRKVNDEN